MGGLVRTLRDKAAEILKGIRTQVFTRRSIVGWLIVIGTTLWTLVDVWGRLDFVVNKWGLIKPWLVPAWARASSISSHWYQLALTVIGLVWIAIAAARPAPAAVIPAPGPSVPPPTLPPEETERDEPKRTATPFFYLGLCWEIEPEFFDRYQNILNPSAVSLNNVILGPFCPACSSSLRRQARGSWTSAGAGPIYGIEDPCRCGHRVPKEQWRPDVIFQDLQEEVYREAQRLVRRKEALPSGPCFRNRPTS